MRASRYLIEKFIFIKPGENVVLVLMAVVIGLCSGAANILFRSAIHFVHEWIFLRGSELLHVGDVWWTRLSLPLIPVTGVCLLTVLAWRYPGKVSGYGFPEFLERVNLRDGRFKFRNLILKTLGPALTIGSGGSAGVEGPIAQIGGTLGSLIGGAFRVSSNRLKVFIAAGAAGTIAATFNAPIAGTLFAIEIVLLGNFEMASFAAIIVSAGIATVVGRIYYGDAAIFTVPSYEMVSLYEIPLYILLGLFVGLLAVGYIRTFHGLRDYFQQLKKVPVLIRPIIGAAIVGFFGIFFPEVMGDGYESIKLALSGDMLWWLMAILIALKIVATSVTLGSGGAGGVFAPALFIGAMVGGTFGVAVHGVLPGITAQPGAYAAVGVGSFLAASTHAPLTAIFLLFEMTGNYEIIIPIMLASIIGVITARGIYHDSIDTVELSRKGLDIHGGRQAAIMSSIRVRQVMDPSFRTIHQDSNLTEVIWELLDGESFYIPVLDDQDELMGMISLQDVKVVLYEETICAIVRAGQLATENPMTITPDDNLGTAIQRFAAKDIDELPVVDSKTGRKVVGMLKRGQVMATYDKEVLRRASLG